MKKIINILRVIVPTTIVTWYTIFGMFNIDIVDFLQQSIGGGLGTYRAFIALVYVVLFLTLVNIGKTAVSGELSKGKVKFFYISAILGFFAFPILGSEFNAPKFTFAPFINAESEYKYGSVMKQSGIEFKLNSCSRSGTKISCSMGVYNLGEDMYFSRGHKSHLIDSEGNNAEVTEFLSGTQSYDNLYIGSISVPVDTKATINMAFETTEVSSAKIIRALYLKLRFDGKDRTIVFRNVSIS